MIFFHFKNISSLLLFLLLPYSSFSSSKVSVYVSAHQDDWQLFMGVNAYNDIANSNDSARVIFVYITAGDYSDCLTESDWGKIPFYLAREQGAKNSVRLVVDFGKKHFVCQNDSAIINNHFVFRSSYGFVTSYFFRLADGGMGGQRNISLRHFRENRFVNNYSIDSLSNYLTWDDLKQTCLGVFLRETKNGDEVYLNLFDTAQAINPGDHSDHYESALLFTDLAQTKEFTVRLFEGYNSGRKEQNGNLNAEDAVKESGLFAVYNQAMVDNSYPSIWNKDYLKFCRNNYFRLLSEKSSASFHSDKFLFPSLLLISLLTLLLSLYWFKGK